MRQVAGLIPTYSSDEFGICSALYELGGMVVMHDASGCNSTYTTHDEPRWYDMDSMIFISAISEMEAIMGDDEKFIGDLIETAGELHPRFIAIVGAPIPYMIGTDFRAIASIVEAETGIPCFGFEANGMHDYTRGVSWALREVAERFCEVTNSRETVTHPEETALEHKGNLTEQKNQNPLVNIIGATPLDFSLNGSIDSIKAWLERHDLHVNCCMAMGSSLEEIKKAGDADVNLVISATGLAAAEVLNERFGQPYVVGVPVKAPVEEKLLAKDKVLIIGEAVYASSLAKTIDCDKVTVACPLERHQGINTSEKGTKESFQGLKEVDVLYTPEEDDIMKAIEEADVVIADPFYQVLVKSVEARSDAYKNRKTSEKDRQKADNIRFIGLPHEAFSGRIFDAVNPDLIGESTFSEVLIRRLHEECDNCNKIDKTR